MAKVIYKMTIPAERVRIVNGIAIITVERYTDIEDVSDAEASGEYQGNMLWECFGHSFYAADDNGNEIQYNDEGEMI